MFLAHDLKYSSMPIQLPFRLFVCYDFGLDGVVQALVDDYL